MRTWKVGVQYRNAVNASSYTVTSWLVLETRGAITLGDSGFLARTRRADSGRVVRSQERRGNRHDVFGELPLAVFIAADKISVQQDATISGMRAIRLVVGADACTRLLHHSGRNNARRDSSGTWRARDSPSRKLL